MRSALDIGSVPSSVGYFYNPSLLRTPAIVSDTDECFYTAVKRAIQLQESKENIWRLYVRLSTGLFNTGASQRVRI